MRNHFDKCVCTAAVLLLVEPSKKKITILTPKKKKKNPQKQRLTIFKREPEKIDKSEQTSIELEQSPTNFLRQQLHQQ